MIEFAVLCLAWTALLVFLARKGTKHLLAKHVAVTLPLAGGVLAALLEAVPTHPLSFGFTIRTLIAVLAGVFAGRLFARIVRHWGEAHEKRAAADPATKPARLVSPLIAAGMLVAGLPVIWHLITSELSLFEEHLTPRDAKTGIAHGCEEIRTETGAPRAALLLHGLYFSPADFKELAPRLAAAGIDCWAPLFPGHGRKPDDLDAVWADDYRKAVRVAYDELAAKHGSVAVVGGSMGATLALLQAAEKRPAALVLVSPYLGRLATPPWCPVSFDTLVGPLSRVARRMFVEEDLMGRAYAVQSLHALRQCRDLARGVDEAAKDVECPTLVLVGGRDEIVPPAFTIEWTSAHLGGRSTTTRFEKSGHDLYHDVEAAAALDATVRFLVEKTGR